MLPVVLKAMKKGKFKNLLSQVSVPRPSGPSCLCFTLDVDLNVSYKILIITIEGPHFLRCYIMFWRFLFWILQVSTKDWILQYAEQDSPSDSDTAPDDSSSTEYDPVSCLLQKTIAVTVYIQYINQYTSAGGPRSWHPIHILSQTIV